MSNKSGRAASRLVNRGLVGGGRTAMSKKRDCWRTKSISAPCQVCGARAEPIHSPLRTQGFFCEAHCPICSPAQEKASGNGPKKRPPRTRKPAARPARARIQKPAKFPPPTTTCCGRALEDSTAAPKSVKGKEIGVYI